MINLTPLSKSISKEKILKEVDYSPQDFVFVSGSLIEGNGNTKSDLDIFVIVDDFSRMESNRNIVYDKSNVKVSFSTVEEIGCDIEYWSLSTVNKLLEQLNSIDFYDTSKRTLNHLSISNSDFKQLTSFLHRFIVSEPVFNNSLYNKTKDKLNINNYFKLMVRSFINGIDNSYDDIVGNLKKGELETSLIIAKNTLISTIMVYLYSNHISLDREKWAYAILKKNSNSHNEFKEILMKFNSLYFDGVSVSNENFENRIEDILLFINNIINLSGKKLGGY